MFKHKECLHEYVQISKDYTRKYALNEWLSRYTLPGETVLDCFSMSAFIVIEGPDGSGTTLHTKLLAENLTQMGLSPIVTAEPTDGPIGTDIRTRLDSGTSIDPLELQKQFCDDRAWHCNEVIEPALNRNDIVISDRYAPSTIVYGQALDLDKNQMIELNKNFVQPTLLFLLLPPFSVLEQRMGERSNRDSL